MLAVRIALAGKSRPPVRPIEMAADDWVAIEDGPRGGKRYRHRKSGRVAYRPGLGDRRAAGGVEQRPKAVQSHVGHVAGKARGTIDDRADAEHAHVVWGEVVEQLMEPRPGEGTPLSEQEAIDKVAERLLTLNHRTFDLLRRKYGETRPGSRRGIARRLMAKLFEHWQDSQHSFRRQQRRGKFFDQFED